MKGEVSVTFVQQNRSGNFRWSGFTRYFHGQEEQKRIFGARVNRHSDLRKKK